MDNQIILYLNLFSIVYFLGLFVAMKVGLTANKPSKYLSYLVVIPVVNLVHNVVYFSDLAEIFPYTLAISSSTSAFFAIFLRAHIWAVLNKKVNFFSVTTYACYLNGVVVAGYVIMLMMGEQKEIDLFLSQMIYEFPAPFFEFCNALFYTSQLIVFIEIGIVVFGGFKSETNSKLNIAKEAHLYARRLLAFIIGAYLFTVLMYFVSTQFQAEFFYLPIAMNLFYFFVLFTFVKFTNNFWSPLEIIPDVREKSTKNLIVSDKEKDVLTRIETLFNQDKPFLESGFNQRKLSDQTGIPIHHISAVINKEYKINFSDYVNSFRVDFAKELLLKFDEKDDKVENVAYDSGFNSKASFYRAFKKHTSTTPRLFILNK